MTEDGRKMDLVKLGKWLMIIGFIIFLPLTVVISLIGFQMDLSPETASFASTVVSYSIAYGLTIMMIGAILYELSKKRLKKKILML